MGRHKNKNRLKNRFAESVEFFHVGLAALEDEIRNRKHEITEREIKVCANASVFIGAVCGRVMLFSSLSRAEKDAAQVAFGAFEMFFAYALNIADDNTNSENIETMRVLARKTCAPVAAETFCRRLTAAKADRVEAMACTIDLAKLCYNRIREFDREVETHSFCEYCVARAIAAEVRPRIEDILLPRVKALQFASSLEGFAVAPQVPQSKGQGIQNLAKYIRDFAEIDRDDVENYDEILMNVSSDYACAKTEITALVAKGILPAERVAHAFGCSVDDIVSLANSQGMRQFLECVLEKTD